MNLARISSRDYKQLSALLTKWTGINLHAKEHLMLGRLGPRLRALRLDNFREYLSLLEAGGRGGPEAQQFINALTTNKTSFFRESHHFDFLVGRVFAEARTRAAQSGRKVLRLWSAGCSRGAEPYTIAMLAAEHLPAAQGWDVRILATDLDTEVLAEAQAGFYEADELAEVPEPLRSRWFTRAAHGYQIQRDVASLVTFAQANLIAEPFPIRGRFDAVFCRNVLIYFDHATQQRIVRELVSRIAATGYLIIGHSESMAATHLPRVQETVGAYQPAQTRAIGTPLEVKSPRAATAAAAPVGGAAAIAVAPAGRPAAPRRKKLRGRSAQLLDGLPVKRIVLGEWSVSGEPLLISTLLGSCVAACLYDPVARVGGMNHFMLPKMAGGERGSARFGVHAMEMLINGLMESGAERSRLRAMAFGAGAVNRSLTSKVSVENGAFVRRFLADERIPLVYERLGGTEPREVFLRADTGDAFVRSVQPQRVAQLQRAESAAYRQKVSEPAEFNPDDALF